MNMKTFSEYVLERRDYSDTGVNRDIIELSVYILEKMVSTKSRKMSFNIKELSSQFPFVKDWDYNNIIVSVNSEYINKVIYLKFSNSIGIYLKTYSRATLNHELTHVMQSIKDTSILLVDYENHSVLSQIKSFFKKNGQNIELLKTLLYVSDEREMDAFIQAFKKYDKDKKIEILSCVLLLKYFNLKNLISDVQSLRQFITVWYQYYGTSIPFFDRLKLQRRIANNTLEVNKEEVNDFIKTINTKLNKIGTTFLRRLSNQYIESDTDVEKFVKLLNKAKLNIVRNDFKYVLDLSNAKKVRISPNQKYNIKEDWE